MWEILKYLVSVDMLQNYWMGFLAYWLFVTNKRITNLQEQIIDMHHLYLKKWDGTLTEKEEERFTK